MVTLLLGGKVIGLSSADRTSAKTYERRDNSLSRSVKQQNARYYDVCNLAFCKNLTPNFCFVSDKSTDKMFVPIRMGTVSWYLVSFTMRNKHSIVCGESEIPSICNSQDITP